MPSAELTGKPQSRTFLTCGESNAHFEYYIAEKNFENYAGDVAEIIAQSYINYAQRPWASNYRKYVIIQSSSTGQVFRLRAPYKL